MHITLKFKLSIVKEVKLILKILFQIKNTSQSKSCVFIFAYLILCHVICYASLGLNIFCLFIHILSTVHIFNTAYLC